MNTIFVFVLFSGLSLIDVLQATNLICFYNSITAPLKTLLENGQFGVTNIDPTLCTHYVYGYAIINSTTNQISYNKLDDVNNNTNGYTSFTALKTRNTKAKFLLALGGLDDSTDGTNKYSTLVANAGRIDTLVTSIVSYLALYNFDGLSLDWLYPNSTDDFKGHSDLIVALKTAFQPKNLILAATVSALQSSMDGYNVSTMNQNLDLVFLNSFDYHTSFLSPKLGKHPHPLYRPTNDSSMAKLNANFSVNYWLITKGLSPSLLHMGLALHGRTWVTGSGAEFPYTPPVITSGDGSTSFVTKEKVILTATDILDYSTTYKFTDPENNTGPYIFDSGLWIGYDDEAMLAIKTNYVLQKNLGGAVLFDISRDDFRNRYNKGINPYTRAVTAVLNSTFYPTTTTTTTTTTPSTTTVNATDVVTSLNGNTSSTASPSTASTTRTTPPAPGKCPSSSYAVLPNPSSCRQLYICLDGVAYPTSCPLAKYFNPVTMRCENDDPTNPKCPSSNSGESKKSEALSYNAVKYDWQVNY